MQSSEAFSMFNLQLTTIYIYGSVQNQAAFHIEFCHFLGVIVTQVINLQGKTGMRFSEFFEDLFRKQIIVEKIFSRVFLYPFTRKMKH